MKLRSSIVIVLAVLVAFAGFPAPALARALTEQSHALTTSAVACSVSSTNTPAINNKSYNTLNEAFEDIQYDTGSTDGYGQTIKTTRPEGTRATVMLSANSTINLSQHIEVLHDVTLDLNGSTIYVDFSYTTDPAFAADHNFAMGFLVSGGSNNHGILTVKDSSAAGTGKIVVRSGGEAIRCQGGGAVTIQSGTYEIPADSEGRYCVECLGGHLTVEGGTFINNRTDQPSASTSYGLGCLVNGAQTGASAGRTTIRGGTFSSLSAAFFCVVNFAGVMEISNPSALYPTVIEGSAGAVSLRGGSASIEGGSFKGVTNVLYAADDSYYQGDFDQKALNNVVVSGGEFTNTGGGTALLVGVRGTGKDLVEVTGGSFVGGILLSPASRACTLSVKGGSFTDLEHLTPRLAAGYTTKQNEEGTAYDVVADPGYDPGESGGDGEATITDSMVGIGNVSIVTYTGSSIEPEVTVMNGDVELKQGEDYTVAYEDNLNVGRATVVVEGINAWSGTARRYFTITERSIVGNTLTFTQNPCPYVAGVDPDPGAGVTLADGTVLEKDRDFTVTYSINEVVGSGTATVRAKGNYTGSLAGNFTVQRGYRVTFVDGVDMHTIAEKVALYGGTVEAPEPPKHTGYLFDAWDKDFSQVTDEMTVTARYVADTTHVVTFVDDYDGLTIGTVRVEDGQAATPPTPPRHAGYTFVSWNKSFDVVKEDLEVRALYTRTGGTGEGTELPSSMLDNARGTAQERGDGSLLVTLTDPSGLPSNGWRIVGGSWYYAGKDGVALMGRVDDKGSTYYFGNDCKLRTGWIWDDTAKGWAWANPSDGPYLGVVAKNCWVWDGGGWYLAGPNGIMRTGWAWVGQTCYHLNTGATGTMSRMDTGWVYDNGWYWCDNSGAMQADRWLCVDNVWYLLGGSGIMLTGWQWRAGVWYYLRDTGAMVTGWMWIDNAWYYFWSDGRMLYDTITPDGARIDASGKWVG